VSVFAGVASFMGHHGYWRSCMCSMQCQHHELLSVPVFKTASCSSICFSCRNFKACNGAHPSAQFALGPWQGWLRTGLHPARLVCLLVLQDLLWRPMSKMLLQFSTRTFQMLPLGRDSANADPCPSFAVSQLCSCGKT